MLQRRQRTIVCCAISRSDRFQRPLLHPLTVNWLLHALWPGGCSSLLVLAVFGGRYASYAYEKHLFDYGEPSDKLR